MGDHMGDFLARFRFGDFAAYFLPGLALEGALIAILWFTPFQRAVQGSLESVSWISAALLACCAYAAGAVISGSSYKLVGPLYFAARGAKYEDPRTRIFPTELAPAVREAFRECLGTLGGGEEWSESHFYIARTAINKRLPAARRCDRMT
jgi:hypothetical protein